MWYLQGVRWAWQPGRGVTNARHIPSLMLLPEKTDIPHGYRNTPSKTCISTTSLYRTQWRIFSSICGVKSDLCCNYSLCKYHKGLVFSGQHESSQGNRYGCSVNKCSVRSLMTSPVNHMFWEKDRKGGYGSEVKKNRKQLIREGLKELRTELSKWQEEMHEKFEDDPVWVRPGDMDKVWVLDNEEALQRWVVTSDSDHGQGQSSGSLTLSPTGHGLFSGHITTETPKDGRVKKAGYCNMTSVRPRKSFKREVCHDWTLYTHLEMRVRGDGRSYLININTAGYFDVNWNDVFSYILYTRGGPYWQIARIPFSKFFLSSKGRVQDKQFPILLSQVVSLGISAGDRVNAPFHLEIDYIGVYFDPDHTEKFAYEMYKVPKFMGY